MTKHNIGQASEIAQGQGKKVVVSGIELAVFNSKGKYYAIANHCTHHGAPLYEGQLEGNIVTCPWHGAQFDITTGRNLTPPASSPTRSFKVIQEGEDLFIEM